MPRYKKSKQKEKKMKNLNNDQKNQLRSIEKNLEKIKGFMESLITSAEHSEVFKPEHIMDTASKIISMVDEADEIVDSMMEDV